MDVALLREVYGSSQEIVALSPYSLRAAWQMAWLGAAGQTQREIGDALGVSESTPAADLEERLAAAGARVAVGNSLWLDSRWPILRAYARRVKAACRAKVEQTRFDDTARACREMNAWIARQTAGIITYLMQPDMLTEYTRLVLINAIYLKAEWQTPFSVEQTTQQPFHGTSGRQSVAMMKNVEYFRYAENADWQMLELPYANGALAMIVMLPQKGRNLDQLVAQGIESDPLANQLKETFVDVRLPRFRGDSTWSLTESLQSLGIQQAFDVARADFSAINGEASGSQNAFACSECIQRVVIDVDEAGTEAAAVTAGMTLGPPSRPTLFEANRPFVFSIRAYGETLFMGCVNQLS